MIKIQCSACKMMIDSDSKYCKQCGEKVVDEQSRTWEAEKLSSIFQGVYETLYSNSGYTKIEFDMKFDIFKNYENQSMNDNDYYRILVDIIFYSGFRASTVDKYLGKIHTYFANYEVVMKYNPEQVKQIKSDPEMIKNSLKIDACIRNSEILDGIVKKWGSVQAYINSFEPNASDENLLKFKNSLEKDFRYIGKITSYHFMTDIGLNVLKPDRVITRIFSRLGLIKDEEDLFETVKVGRAFSLATNLPIRYIDIIFVMYGQLNLDKIEHICSEKKPKCQKCGAKTYCLYGNSRMIELNENDK